MPEGLSLANGIAGGADAFIRSFQQARMQKYQMQMQKNSALADILLSQVRDDNTTYYQKAKALDLIPGLYGIKNLDRPLSQILGHDKLNEEDFKTGERTINNPMPSGITHEELMKSVATTNPAPTRQVDTTIKRGNLTPLEYKKQLGIRDDESEIVKQTRLWEIKLKLEKKAAQDSGFKVVSENILPNDKYKLVMMNEQGITKEKILDGVPKAVEIAKLRGQNIPGNLGQLVRARGIVFDYEADPTSHPESTYLAAKDALESFEKTGQLKSAQITALNQGATGTKPLSLANIDTGDRLKTDQQLKVQKDIDDAEAEVQASYTNVQAANTEKQRALKEKEDAELAFNKVAADYTPRDEEYKAAARLAKEARERYDGLEKEFGKLVATDKLNKAKLTGAQKRAGLLTSSNVSDEVKYKKQIEIFKNNPKNAEKVAALGLTDAQIVQILRNAKLIQ